MAMANCDQRIDFWGLHVDSEEITQRAASVYTMLEFMIERLDWAIKNRYQTNEK